MNEADGDLCGLVDDATTVLLLVPSAGPADSACIDLLTDAEPEETNVLSVAVDAAPDERVSVWQQHLGDRRPRQATIVNANAASPSDSQAAGTDAFPEIELEPLADDAELVDVVAAVSLILGRWAAAGDPSVLCLHSVTGLLGPFGREDVISAVKTLNAACDRTSTVAHHHMDPTAHSEETVELFRPLYDRVLEYDPETGWTVLGTGQSANTSSFGESTTPPGGVGKWDPDRPETVPIPYSFDQALDLISVPRRRTLLYHLKDRTDEEIELDDLVDQVVARERSIPVREPPESRDSVVVSLTHTHLPKLADLGILAYDSDERIVHYHGNPALESFVRYIETLELG
jgi:hypothetical protein